MMLQTLPSLVCTEPSILSKNQRLLKKTSVTILHVFEHFKLSGKLSSSRMSRMFLFPELNQNVKYASHYATKMKILGTNHDVFTFM